jgi:hypothetical protein
MLLTSVKHALIKRSPVHKHLCRGPEKANLKVRNSASNFKLEFEDLPFRALSELQIMFTETKVSYVSRV